MAEDKSAHVTSPTSSRESRHTVSHLVNRLVIDADAPFDDLRRRYESLVPDIDVAALTALIEMGDLDKVKRYTAEHTPHTFARFWTFDPTPMMRLAGQHNQVITYMMGNNVIVETMFRHDPAIMLYAPLRTAIYEDSAGATHFSIDQPSTRFASFGDPRITEVGLQLDSKLAALLQLLDLPVPGELEPTEQILADERTFHDG